MLIVETTVLVLAFVASCFSNAAPQERQMLQERKPHMATILGYLLKGVRKNYQQHVVVVVDCDPTLLIVYGEGSF